MDALRAQGEKVQLHLGCGKRQLPGFLHLDRDGYKHVDWTGDVSSLGEILDGEADLIYACHILEYWDHFEAKAVLQEWRRVLKPGGLLRLSVPDFDKVVQVYLEYKDMKLLYGFLYGRYSKDGKGSHIYHRTIYTEDTLRDKLLEAGFSEFRPYDWRQTIHRDHDDYSQAYIPHMQKESGLMMSLNVEAVK